MERTLKLVGKTSNEIFLLRYPATLLDFCDFDLSLFAKDSVDLCNEALKTGTLNDDRAAELRKDIQNAHCYIRQHIRTVYEKVVLDCWIDYVCRRDNIGDSALWNRFVRCKSPFEKAVFARLCDFRYNRDINQWLNIVRVQDYARTKVNFVFTETVKTVEEVAARRNYFDLAFSVTARELGCRIEDLGVTKVFSVGRIPTAPFMFPNISKEIVRNVLAEFDYSDDYSDVEEYGDTADQIAMDAFSRMKEGLPQELSSYSIVRGKMENYPEKIFMPCSLKAVVDLEIDTMIENGGWLAKCKRCGRYFMKDNEHPEDYCSLYIPNGKTCLELWEEENPKPKVTSELEKRCAEVTDEMYQRVDKTMSVKEYDYWHNYLEAMKKKVDNGEIAPEELENFLNYSLEVDITRSKPIVEVPKKEPEPPKKGVVKPFVPERINRSDIPPTAPEPDPEEERALREGFFTSPTKQRRKNEQPQISHIIRGGESLGGESHSKPDPAGFQPFGSPVQPKAPVQQAQPVQHAEFKEPEQKRSPFENFQRLEERIEEEKQRPRQELRERPVRSLEQNDNDRDAFAFSMPRRREFSENEPAERERRPETQRAETQRAETQRAETQHAERPRYDYDDDYAARERPRRASRFEPEFTDESDDRYYNAVPEPVSQPAQLEPPPPPKPRVIRKNAAAISAYGKMAGASVTTAPPELEIVSEPPTMDLTDIAPPEKREPEPIAMEPPSRGRDVELDDDPFKDIESIFDVLEQSESDMGARPKRSRPRGDEAVDHGDKPLPRAVTKKNAPSGIWTEDRELFDEPSDVPEQSELDMLKEKKHGRSNKTKHLYDAIMREPNDNPNFRR
ncbi:MAG: hypothetical protein HDT43_11190 [Ruminococcaceae bacterium]|nr:hypothetical protein [Oscillospiraceae bacterium]